MADRIEFVLLEELVAPVWYVDDLRHPGEKVRRGGFISANRVTRTFRNQQVPNPDCVAFQERASALVAVKLQFTAWDADAGGYEFWLRGWNVQLDLDNMPKAVLDAFNGLLYPSDHYLIDLHVSRRLDWGAVRYQCTVETREALKRPKRPPEGAIPLF